MAIPLRPHPFAHSLATEEISNPQQKIKTLITENVRRAGEYTPMGNIKKTAQTPGTDLWARWVIITGNQIAL
jgi:hypothetical protein